jgi:hypothetical protein
MNKLFIFFVFLLSVPSLFGQSCTSHVTTSTFASAFSSATTGAVLCLAPGSYGAFTGAAKAGTVTLISDSSVGGTQTNVTFSSANLDSSARNLVIDTVSIGGSNITATGAMHILFHNIHWTSSVCFTEGVGSTNFDVIYDGGDFTNIGQSCTEGRFGINVSPAGTPRTGNTGPVVKNTVFSGSGPSDGVQTTGNGPSGVVIGPGNTFINILESGCGAVHCDPIQPFSLGGAITITGNFFYNDSSMIADYDCDGPVNLDNNVFHTAANPVSLSGASNSTVTHNTFDSGTTLQIYAGNPGNCTNSNMTITNNILQGGTDFHNVTGTIDYNLAALSADRGVHGVSGTPVYIGGTTPSTYAGWQLAGGSPGKNAANDGKDIGVTFAGGITQAGQPTCSPATGTANPVPVTLSTVSGGTICYNFTGSPATNGSTGCTTGTKYTGAITIGVNETLSAVAGGTGFTDSTIRSCTYTVTAPGAPTLTLGPITMNGGVIWH